MESFDEQRDETGQTTVSVLQQIVVLEGPVLTFESVVGSNADMKRTCFKCAYPSLQMKQQHISHLLCLVQIKMHGSSSWSAIRQQLYISNYVRLYLSAHRKPAITGFICRTCQNTTTKDYQTHDVQNSFRSASRRAPNISY